MSQITAEELTAKKCQPCEGGVPPVPKDEAERLLESLPGWELTNDGQRIRREWVVRNFMAAMDFFNRVAELAEDEGHHPDLHLVGKAKPKNRWIQHARQLKRIRVQLDCNSDVPVRASFVLGASASAKV